MTHDPMCPAPLCDWTGKPGSECYGYEDCHHLCQCDLIRRVRIDHRDRIVKSLRALATHVETNRGMDDMAKEAWVLRWATDLLSSGNK